MIDYIVEKAKFILEELRSDPKLGKYVDPTLHIPEPYVGMGPIKLIVLGQDPTIRDIAARASIKKVLNLDKRGSAGNYLSRICQGIGIDRKQNIYATNLLKNFFTVPPTEIKEINAFKEFLNVWLPLLIEELGPFKNVPVITLGEPVLRLLLKEESLNPLRQHWGYTEKWQISQFFDEFKYVNPEVNWLSRRLFPFPHQPTLRKEFYKKRRDDYIKFVKANAFLES